MKILISGGHLTPALAFIEYVKAEHPDVELVFAGRTFSQDRLKQKSQEMDEVKRRDVRFITVSAPRLNTGSVVDKGLSLLQLAAAFFRSLLLILKERPTVFLSFGSYLAVPLAAACAVLRVPIVTHEQTRAVGESTKFVAKLAKALALTHSSSLDYINHRKVVITGNPLRPALFKTQPQPAWISRTPGKPLLYITGGNQGSEVINTTIQQVLKTLVKHWQVIHQCGAATTKRNYLQEARKAKSSLPQTLQDEYVVKEWISEEELGWIYHQASAVIARAGANTVLELAALGVPSILIPLPFAHYDEQTLNARFLADQGGAILLSQKELMAESLLTALAKVKRHTRSMKTKLKQVAVPTDGSAKLYQLLVEVIR